MQLLLFPFLEKNVTLVNKITHQMFKVNNIHCMVGLTFFLSCSSYLNFTILWSLQVAMTGFTEVLTFILCSSKENFAMLNRKEDKPSAVTIGNPRSSDFEVCIHSISIFRLAAFEVTVLFYFVFLCHALVSHLCFLYSCQLSLNTSYLHASIH